MSSSIQEACTTPIEGDTTSSTTTEATSDSGSAEEKDARMGFFILRFLSNLVTYIILCPGGQRRDFVRGRGW